MVFVVGIGGSVVVVGTETPAFTFAYAVARPKAMRTEFGIGILIIGITAAMVVSPPAVATVTPSSPPITPGSTVLEP